MLGDSIPKKSLMALMFSICTIVFIIALCFVASGCATKEAKRERPGLVDTSEQLSAKDKKSMDYEVFVLGELVVPKPDGTLSFAPGALEKFPDETQLKMIVTELEKINKDIRDGGESPFIGGDTRLFKATGPLSQDELGRWWPLPKKCLSGPGHYICNPTQIPLCRCCTKMFLGLFCLKSANCKAPWCP
jgi:hypothetical protein